MRHLLARGILLAALAASATALPLPALADRCAGPVSAEQAIGIARAAGVARVEKLECDDGLWEVEGRDATGREIEVEIDPRTGRIVKVERDD